MENIIVGADAYGTELKNSIKEYLENKGFKVIDVGTYDKNNPVLYFNAAALVAKKIQDGEAKRGILFCGTGMGVSIVANKFKGIYASVVESEYTGKMCKAVNFANVLAIGQMIVSDHKAKMAVDNWLNTNFLEGFDGDLKNNLENAIKEIEKIENQNFK